jgi:hypothetical protein
MAVVILHGEREREVPSIVGVQNMKGEGVGENAWML